MDLRKITNRKVLLQILALNPPTKAVGRALEYNEQEVLGKFKTAEGSCYWVVNVLMDSDSVKHLAVQVRGDGLGYKWTILKTINWKEWIGDEDPDVGAWPTVDNGDNSPLYTYKQIAALGANHEQHKETNIRRRNRFPERKRRK